MSDDSLMDRFDKSGTSNYRAKDGIIAVFVAVLVLVLVSGGAVTRDAETQKDGILKDIQVQVGHPTGYIADHLPFHDAAHSVTKGLSPDDELSKEGGFNAGGSTAAAGGVPVVTPEAFSNAQLGLPPAAKKPLKTLLVTGDSLSTPLDHEMARRLSSKGVKVIQEPKLGTGISKTFLVDWGQLSATQVKKYKPDAVILFIGANEGFPITIGKKDEECCSAAWAAEYANRARQMVQTFRQGGKAKVYWINIMAPRDRERQKVSRVVNAADDVAVQPWASQARRVDSISIFTPGFKYRDSMDVGGKDTIVRESDGIHLNPKGASIMADHMVEELALDFTF